MVIRAADRLEDVLGTDEGMLERLLAASPALEGLRNPTTRRVMGRLATVGDVARMAGLEPDILVRRLNRVAPSTPAVNESETMSDPDDGHPSGSAPETGKEEMTAMSTRIPPFLAELPAERRVDLDVRDDLRNGREPFSRIMAARAALPQDGVLRLRATFEPQPLYAVMARQGYDHWTEELAPDDWRVWFHPRRLAEEGNAEAAPGKPAGQEAAPPVASAPVARVADPAEDVVILDVRGMEPPEPMAHTLAALETLPAGKTLLQINERVPQFLLPRLSELGFEYTIREQEEGVVRVFIRRSADAEASDPHPDSGAASR